MRLLALDKVSKGYSGRAGEQVVLGEVSLDVEPGELVVIWGLRGSGRSTLLRVAAGIEPPDAGIVRFEGHDLAKHGDRLLGGPIGYCERMFRCAEGQGVLEQVTVGLLARGVFARQARLAARRALARVDAQHFAARAPGALDAGEHVRIAIARMLALQPALLVVDDPTRGVDLLDRDGIVELLRSLADEGIAILASTTESAALAGADRALVISEGELRGAPPAERATLIPLRRPLARRAAR